jgi:hypothetical protein
MSPLSPKDFSVPDEDWNSDISGVEMLCEKINSEFKRKMHVSYQFLNYINILYQ